MWQPAFMVGEPRIESEFEIAIGHEILISQQCEQRADPVVIYVPDHNVMGRQ